MSIKFLKLVIKFVKNVINHTKKSQINDQLLNLLLRLRIFYDIIVSRSHGYKKEGSTINTIHEKINFGNEKTVEYNRQLLNRFGFRMCYNSAPFFEN